MGSHRESPSVLPPIFPSYRRRYVRVPPEYAYESIIHILRKNLEIKDEEIKHLRNLTLRTSLGGRIGVNLTIHIVKEGEISVLNLKFNYKRMIVSASLLLLATIILSLLFKTSLPILGLAIFLPIAYQVNLKVIKFLNILTETLPFLEREYAYQMLLKDRERWRKHRKDVEALYEKLRKKHIETWGNTNVLEYKIQEYQSAGLTYEEAIMKIAEEEGITTD